MKGHNPWGAQKGTRVRYAIGRASGTGVVKRVLKPHDGSDNGQLLIVDDVTGREFDIASKHVMSLPSEGRKRRRGW